MVNGPCLYEMRIRHTRLEPLYNTFQLGTYMWCFDLDSPPRLRWPVRHLARYRARDHLDIRAHLREAGIEAARIRVLTNLRVLGYVFNPISVYWCYGHDGALVAHVAEVHNTYGERHAYVLPSGSGSSESSVDKEMTVSPFYPVDGTYRLRIGSPGETLSVTVSLDRGKDLPFVASLYGRQKPVRTTTVLQQSFRYPAAPLRGRIRIQLEGLKLWRRGLEVQPR